MSFVEKSAGKKQSIFNKNHRRIKTMTAFSRRKIKWATQNDQNHDKEVIFQGEKNSLCEYSMQTQW